MIIREDYPNGFYYGFPRCCIESFVRDIVTGQFMYREPRKLSGSGYIPCAVCNAKTEQELIDTINSRRSHPRAFPDKV